MGRRDYSGTPLARKLGVREGMQVLVLGAPEGFALEGRSEGVEVRTRVGGRYDVALLFCSRRAQLARRFPRLAASLPPHGRLWVCWPKKASGVPTDLSFGEVQRTGLAAGLVDNKSASIDEAFQGVQFVHRRAGRR